jgi:phosphate transport system permease protein
VTTLELPRDVTDPEGSSGADAGGPSQPGDAAPAVPRPRRTRRLTRQDLVAFCGSLLASFALVEVGYAHILDFSGVLGFLLCWLGVYLAVYAVVLSVTNPRVVVVERLVTSLLWVVAAIVLFAVGSTIVFVLAKGWPALHHLNFFTQDMAGVNPSASFNHGGVYHAIIGTAVEIAIAVAISLPLGLTTAVYMTEVRGRGSEFVRTVVEAMTALPEILAGLFIYVFLIVDIGLPKSGLAAAIAMSVTMTPIIARAGDVALRVVPNGLREASAALGGKHWRTVWKVTLPTARSGLATALILAIARGIGETAIVLICSISSNFLTYNPRGAMNSLPLFIYSMWQLHEPAAITRAFAAASVLLMMVLLLFVVTRLLVRTRRSR